MYPENLKYTKEHEWAKIEGDVAVVGITHHAQDSLGDVVFVELPKVGAALKQSADFGVVESVKTVSTLYSPLSGEVLETNAALTAAPQLVNEDPYGKGWMVKIKISDKNEISALLGAEDYKKLIQK